MVDEYKEKLLNLYGCKTLSGFLALKEIKPFTQEYYKIKLKHYGIWRALIEERFIIDTNTQQAFIEVTFCVPKTSSTRVKQFIKDCTTIGSKVVVRELKSPLRFKKFSYNFVCKKD